MDTVESLFPEIPRDFLPTEYGGEAGTTKDLGADLVERFQNYKAFFEDDDNFGVDESKRLSKSKYAEDIFGINGSFRQITLD